MRRQTPAPAATSASGTCPTRVGHTLMSVGHTTTQVGHTLMCVRNTLMCVGNTTPRVGHREEEHAAAHARARLHQRCRDLVQGYLAYKKQPLPRTLQ